MPRKTPTATPTTTAVHKFGVGTTNTSLAYVIAYTSVFKPGPGPKGATRPSQGATSK